MGEDLHVSNFEYIGLDMEKHLSKIWREFNGEDVRVYSGNRVALIFGKLEWRVKGFSESMEVYLYDHGMLCVELESEIDNGGFLFENSQL